MLELMVVLDVPVVGVLLGVVVSAGSLAVTDTEELDRDVSFVPKVRQIDHEWDKSRTFSDQISVGAKMSSQNVLKSDLIKVRI